MSTTFGLWSRPFELLSARHVPARSLQISKFACEKLGKLADWAQYYCSGGGASGVRKSSVAKSVVCRCYGLQSFTSREDSNLMKSRPLCYRTLLLQVRYSAFGQQYVTMASSPIRSSGRSAEGNGNVEILLWHYVGCRENLQRGHEVGGSNGSVR